MVPMSACDAADDALSAARKGAASAVMLAWTTETSDTGHLDHYVRRVKGRARTPGAMQAR
jgi:hypothetical protein